MNLIFGHRKCDGMLLSEFSIQGCEKALFLKKKHGFNLI